MRQDLSLKHAQLEAKAKAVELQNTARERAEIEARLHYEMALSHMAKSIHSVMHDFLSIGITESSEGALRQARISARFLGFMDTWRQFFVPLQLKEKRAVHGSQALTPASQPRFYVDTRRKWPDTALANSDADNRRVEATDDVPHGYAEVDLYSLCAAMWLQVLAFHYENTQELTAPVSGFGPQPFVTHLDEFSRRFCQGLHPNAPVTSDLLRHVLAPEPELPAFASASVLLPTLENDLRFSLRGLRRGDALLLFPAEHKWLYALLMVIYELFYNAWKDSIVDEGRERLLTLELVLTGARHSLLLRTGASHEAAQHWSSIEEFLKQSGNTHSYGLRSIESLLREAGCEFAVADLGPGAFQSRITFAAGG